MISALIQSATRALGKVAAPGAAGSAVCAAVSPAAGPATRPASPSPTDAYSGPSASGPAPSRPTSCVSAPAAAADPGLLAQLHAALTTARTGASSAVVGGRKPSAPTAEAAAAELYRTGGDTAYDLRKPGQVLELVRRSPQIDARTGVDPSNDGVSRCATAATTNALLLSKAPAANAEALRKTAAEFGITPTADQTAAIDAMGKGTLTPNQAAQIQELLYDGVRINGRQGAGGRQGMTGGDLLELTATLKKHGAFGGAAVDYTLSSVDDADGNKVGHWTVSVQTDHLQSTSVDSWPGRDGRARVQTALAYSTHSGTLAEDGGRPRNLLGEVSMRPYETEDGRIETQYLRRERATTEATTVEEWRWDFVMSGSIPRTRVPPDRSYALR